MAFFEKQARLLEVPNESEQPEYETRGGRADGEGVLFEVLAAGLVFLRCVRRRLTFLLSSNDTAGGDKFDDLILTWQDEDKGQKEGAPGFNGALTMLPSETGNKDCPSLRALFVQQKYKTSPKKKTILFDHLTKKSEEFCIRNFHDSYVNIRDTLNGGNYALVVYTNSTLGEEVEHMFIAQDAESSPWMRLLEAGGCVYKLNPDDKDVKGQLEKGDEEFIQNFYLFCGQSSNESMKDKICSELQLILVADESYSKTMCEDLCSSIAEWMKKHKFYLRSDWKSWLNIVYSYIKNKVTICNSLVTRIKYSNVKTLEAYIEGCNPARIRPPEDEATALTATKVHQIIRDEKHIMVSVTRLSVLEKKILCCWGRFSRWLIIVDDHDGVKHSYYILDRLRALVGPNRRLVIVSDKGHDSFLDTCQSGDILEESWLELLKVKIMLNSEQYSCHLGDLCDTDSLKAMLDGNPKALAALSQLPGPVRMGQDLDPLPKNHIRRDLISCMRVNLEFFSSLGHKELCVMDEVCYELLSNKVVLKNTVKFEELEKYLSASDPVYPLFIVTSNMDCSTVQMISSKYADVHVYVLSHVDDEWLYVEEQSISLLNVVHSANDRIIIEGNPGIGKSTMLLDMAWQLKGQHPSWWILRIDLLKYSEVFESCDSGVKASVDILTRVVYNKKNIGIRLLEHAILEHCLRQYPRIVCLVDGFDEICPDYADKCLQALQELAPGRGKLVVATRPSVTDQLEAALRALAHTLPAFSDKQLEEFHSRPLSDMGVTDKVRDLLKIPLFSVMYAEILESGDSVEDIVSLYEAFFERKFRRLYEEKLGDDLSKPLNRKMYQKERMEHEEHLGFLSVSHLFPVLRELCTAQLTSDDRDDLVKAGVISKFIDDKPVFIHRTFAEHFLAKWCFSKDADSLRADVYRKALSDTSLEFFVESFDRMASKDRLLLTAVLNHRETEVKSLLENGADPMEEDKCGRNSLHMVAAYSHDATILRLLVESLKGTEAVKGDRSASGATKKTRGQSLNRKRRSRKSARVSTVSRLAAASKAAVPSVIGPSQYYVEETAAFGAEDGLLRWPPLRYAAERRRWRAVAALLEAGAQLSHLGDFQRGLHSPHQLWRVFEEKGYKALFDHIVAGDNPGRTSQMLELRDENQRCLEIMVGLSIVCAEMSVGQYLLINDEANKNGNYVVTKLLLLKQMDMMKTFGRPVLDLPHFFSGPSQLDEDRLRPAGAAGDGCSSLQWPAAAAAAAEAVMVRIGYGKTLLHEAVRRGDVERVRQLIEAGADVNAQGNMGQTAIYLAALCDHVQCIKCLHSAGADLNLKDKIGRTPLHCAAYMGRSQSVKVLLAAGADALTQDSDGLTPLHKAAIAGNAECVRLLADAAVDNLEVRDRRGLTALHFAARSGETECVKSLLAAGAHPSPVDNKLATPLHYTAGRGSAECVRLLLQEGADVAERGEHGATALHWAARSGNPDCVRLLLEAGADVREKDGKGVSPLHSAVVAGSPACIRLLLEKGADVNTSNNNGVTPLHYAAQQCKAECLELLLAAGAYSSAVTNKMNTPLHMAAEKGRTECVKLLLAAGAHRSPVDDVLNTPLHLAALRGNAECVRLLVQAGADVAARNDRGATALHAAVQSGNPDCVRLLLDAGADVLEKDGDGDTPLNYAAVGGNPSCIRLLLEKGADVNTSNNNGVTPLHWAASFGKQECVDLLLAAAAEPLALH